MMKHTLPGVQSKEEQRKAFLEKMKLLKVEAIQSTSSYIEGKEKEVFKLISQDYFEKDEHTRFVRFYNFNWKEEEKYIEFLKGIIEKDECKYIKYEALKELLNIGLQRDSILPFYINLLESQDSRLRHYAAYAISKYSGNNEGAVSCADALTKALDDDDKFVRYRVLWAINKMSSLLRRELKTMLNKLDQIQEAEGDLLLKQQIKLARDITVYDGTAWDGSDSEKVDEDTKKKLFKMISNWKNLDYPARYETLKLIEETFDSMLGKQAEFIANDKANINDEEKRKENTKEARERALAMEKELMDVMGSGKSNLLFTALVDTEDFVRYRAAGVIHRIISRIEAARRNSANPVLLKHIDNRTIMDALKSSCAIEKENVVRIKMLESHFLCKYALAGLTISDGFYENYASRKLIETIYGDKKQAKESEKDTRTKG